CFCFQAEDGIRDRNVTGVQTCALPIFSETPQPGCWEMNCSTSISDWEMLMSALGRLIRRRVAERKSKTLDAISETSTSGRTSFALCPLTLGLGRWGEAAVLLITVPRS